MAQLQETIQIVNSQVLNDDEEFSNGFYEGCLYFYDTGCPQPQPLTCQSIAAFIRENLADLDQSEQWNIGFVCGWIAALSENNQHNIFTSISLPEPAIASPAKLRSV